MQKLLSKSTPSPWGIEPLTKSTTSSVIWFHVHKLDRTSRWFIQEVDGNDG
jgi:hypothetical protein